MGSRSAVIGGAAVCLAADKILAKCRSDRRASARGGSPISSSLTAASSWPAPIAVSLKEVAKAAFSHDRLPPGVEPGFYESGTFAPTAFTYPKSCHVCEVEIDPETGETALVAYTVVDDVER